MLAVCIYGLVKSVQVIKPELLLFCGNAEPEGKATQFIFFKPRKHIFPFYHLL